MVKAIACEARGSGFDPSTCFSLLGYKVVRKKLRICCLSIVRCQGTQLVIKANLSCGASGQNQASIKYSLK